ncbi:MAG: Nitrogen regulatory protein [Pedosphaera sp.]|nr:Nitrogen regulatory protein [Pedosphaera sp.]
MKKFEATIAAMERPAQTGKTGNSKVFVSAVEQAIRICTEEKAAPAI